MQDVFLYEGERLDAVNEKINLIQKKDGLTFGTDAFLLASFIKPRKSGRALELGAGTGIISLLLAAKEKFSEIHALEVQEDFATLTARNVEINGLEDKIKISCLDVRELRASSFGEFDVVFSNPPYMTTDSGKRNRSDGKYIARHEVCGDIGDFCAAAARLLKYVGRFYCVFRPDRLSELMQALHEHRLEPKEMVFVHADEKSEPSMVLISATKGGAPSLRVLPPLLLHEASDVMGTRPLSARAQKIYDTMSFDKTEA